MKYFDLDCVNKIDFTKGFSTFHVKWPINKNLNNERSKEFKTVVQNKVFKWFMHILNEENNVTFYLASTSCNVLTDILFRVILCNSKKKVFFNQSFSALFHPQMRSNCATQYAEAGIRFKEEDEKLLYATDDIVLHCWLEIPNSTLTSDGYLTIDNDLIKNSFRLNGAVSHSIDFIKLFDGVLDENSEMASLSDVTLVILDKQKNPVRKFFCHRNVLAVRSSVFRCMFVNKRWEEGSKREIEIKEVDDKAMQFLLRYMYTGDLPEEDEGEGEKDGEEEDDEDTKNIEPPDEEHAMVLEIINVADKYNLPELINFCVANLITYFPSDNHRIEQLKFADCHQLPQLKAVCLASLCTNLPALEKKNIDEDIWSDVHQALTKRQFDTKEICLDE